MKFNLPGTVGQNGRATGKERKWKIFWSYFPDWLLTIFLWVSLLSFRSEDVADQDRVYFIFSTRYNRSSHFRDFN